MTHSISRREFLGGALAVGAVGALSSSTGLLLGQAPAAAAARRPLASPIERTLVLCTLYGGNDGLNTVVPYEDSAYLANRPNIELGIDKLLPLGDGLGLNAAMPGVKALWDAGQVAIVQGVGYPNQSLSHFQAMAIWQSASPSGDEATGWLGRWLDRTRNDPLRACSVGPTIEPALAGNTHRASAVQDSTSASAQLPYADPHLLGVYRELQEHRPTGTVLENAIGTSGFDMLSTSHTFARALRAEPAPTLPEGTDDGDIGTQLDVVSSLIRADLPTQAYGVSQSGYDTHSDEVDTQSELLGDLDTAITSFFSSLVGSSKGAGTVLAIYTEFGRRVASNGSDGTDHGTANNVFVIGPSVRGGFYGELPSLTRLDDNGNLVHGTDFRSVYATLLDQVIGVDPKSFLGKSFAPVPFLG